MMFLGDESIYKRKDAPRLMAQALGDTSHGITMKPSVNNVNIVTPLGRDPIQDIRFSDGSYSSYGIDINPFGIAYRADTPGEFVTDLALATAQAGAFLIPGGAVLGRGVRLAKGGLDFLTN